MAQTFSAPKIVRYLLKRFWLVALLASIAAAGTYFWARAQPEYYKATINTVPAQPEKDLLGSAVGGLSTALKDFGLSKLGGSSGTSYEFAVVMFSRSLRDSLINEFELIKEYELEGEQMKYVYAELENNIEIELKAEGNYQISIWSRDRAKAVKMTERFVQLANSVANDIQRKDAIKTTTYLENRVFAIDRALRALTDSLGRYSKDYLLFSPEDQAQASASALAEAKAMILKQETVIGIMESSYGSSDPQVASQRSLIEQLNAQYEDMQQKPGFAGKFAVSEVAGIGANYMRLVGEFEAYAKLKAIMLPTLEQARLDQMKATPSLLIVDPPVLPEKRDRPKRMLAGIGAGLGVGIATILVLLGRIGWVQFMASDATDAA